MAVEPPLEPDRCAVLGGPMQDACRDTQDMISTPGGGTAGDGPSMFGFATDPLGSVADGCAEAAAWIIGKLATAVNATTRVDFANPGFVRQYAIVFAAATFLTLILWLLAVAKRAARGVPLTQAFSEAIGFLWLTVIASAFTPLALHLMVALTDAVTMAVATGTRGDTQRFLDGLAGSLDADKIGGGPIMLIFISLFALLAAAIIWIELLIRAAMLYVGAILGCAVYAGLVDRALWHHVRRWAGIMIAIDLTKPVIVIVLGLATAVTAGGGSEDSLSAALTGLAILFLSIFASVVIYRFVPAFGDDMAQIHYNRRLASASGPAAAINGPATHMRQGIA
ncbi:MAG: hypothetical protein ACRDPK_18870, partial [Carbonactinosporaceae bacterium]